MSQPKQDFSKQHGWRAWTHHPEVLQVHRRGPPGGSMAIQPLLTVTNSDGWYIQNITLHSIAFRSIPLHACMYVQCILILFIYIPMIGMYHRIEPSKPRCKSLHTLVLAPRTFTLPWHGDHGGWIWGFPRNSRTCHAIAGTNHSWKTHIILLVIYPIPIFSPQNGWFPPIFVA